MPMFSAFVCPYAYLPFSVPVCLCLCGYLCLCPCLHLRLCLFLCVSVSVFTYLCCYGSLFGVVFVKASLCVFRDLID